MKRLLKSRLVLCIMIVILFCVGIAVALDVIVKPSEVDAPYLSAYNIDAGDINVDDDVEISDNLLVLDDATIADDLTVLGMICCGKISGGYFDPKWMQLERETRADVITSVSEVVAPEKQDGAILFFNAKTKRLEIYIASEGAFYDLQGNLLEMLGEIVQPVTQYKDAYYLDPHTGQVKSHKVPVLDKYVVKKGYELDKNTGQFLDKTTGMVVTKEEAVEIKAALED